MRISTSIFLAILFVASACKNNPVQKAEPDQGTVTYRISYPDSLSYGVKTALLPKEIVLVFKGDKATFIASAGMGMVQLVNLLDFKTRTAASLLIDNLRENAGCRLTPEEIRENENHVHYRFVKKEETKKIAGFDCHRVEVEEPSTGRRFDVYACDGIRFPYWNSPFAGTDRLLLEYSHTIQNLGMKLVATKVDLATPVDTTLFELKGNYKWMNQKDFYAYLSVL